MERASLTAVRSCLRLESSPLVTALRKATVAVPVKREIMVTTTSSSIRVNPRFTLKLVVGSGLASPRPLKAMFAFGDWRSG